MQVKTFDQKACHRVRNSPKFYQY